MAKKSQSILGTLTGHLANWITGSGQVSKAKKAISSRSNRIDAAVNAATSGSGSTTPATKKKYPWQNQ